MPESATEPQSEQEWVGGLSEIGDLDGSESEVPITAIVDLDEGEATADEGSPPETAEVEADVTAEVDAEAPKEVGDAAEGDEVADAALEVEPGEAPTEAEAEAAKAPDAAPDGDPKAPDEPEQDWDWQPHTLRADKTELDIPGVLVAEGQGMWIPAASLP